MEERSIILLSNVRQEDSLSHFRNPIPSGMLNPHFKHQIALEGFGFHANFKSAASPQNPLLPSLISIFRKDFEKTTGVDTPGLVHQDLSLKLLTQNKEDFHLNLHRSYTPFALAKHMNKLATFSNTKLGHTFRGLPCYYDKGTVQFGQHEFPFRLMKNARRREKHQTILFFEQRFAQVLQLPATMTAVTIDGHPYYGFDWAREEVDLKSSQTIHVCAPQLIYIRSKTIENTLVDDNFDQLLRRVALSSLSGQQYVSYCFPTLHFIDALPEVTNSIHIQLLDENQQQLRLSSGFATYIILKVRSQPRPFINNNNST